ncbi:hypothetical protein CA607_02340 [Caulobacter vibrioides]|nr:hypothetical protein CA607_02340 [Caulobacter vibrioides]
MNVLVARANLLLIAPLLALVAILIKLESCERVPFRQFGGYLAAQSYTFFRSRSIQFQENGGQDA